MRRGVKARAYLADFFRREVPARRNGEGQDFFLQFCRVRDEAGEPLSADTIADHMNFLMMAAHDTVTSPATSLVMLLGRTLAWQERLRAEVAAHWRGDGEVPHERPVECEWAFKEALRLMPPVPSIPRRALRDFDVGGYRIPAGTFVAVNPAYTHGMAEHWPEPERFDPKRFSPEGARGRHRFAWVGALRRRRALVHRAALRDHAGAHPARTPAVALPHRAGAGRGRGVGRLPHPQAARPAAADFSAAVTQASAGSSAG